MAETIDRLNVGSFGSDHVEARSVEVAWPQLFVAEDLKQPEEERFRRRVDLRPGRNLERPRGLFGSCAAWAPRLPGDTEKDR